MKMIALSILVLLAVSCASQPKSEAGRDPAQASVGSLRELATKTIAGYTSILNSQELKTCKQQGQFVRVFTNSCSNFLDLTHDALEKIGDSLDRNLKAYQATIVKPADLKDTNERVRYARQLADQEQLQLLLMGVRLSQATVSAIQFEAVSKDSKKFIEEVITRLNKDIKDMELNYLK